LVARDETSYLCLLSSLLILYDTAKVAIKCIGAFPWSTSGTEGSLPCVCYEDKSAPQRRRKPLGMAGWRSLAAPILTANLGNAS
jgi:hypothetical protein